MNSGCACARSKPPLQEVIEQVIGIGSGGEGELQSPHARCKPPGEYLRPLGVRIGQYQGYRAIAQGTQNIGFPLLLAEEREQFRAAHELIPLSALVPKERYQERGLGAIGTPSFPLQRHQEMIPRKD